MIRPFSHNLKQFRIEQLCTRCWHLYGGEAPKLYSLALRVLSQSVNAPCAKRCWSTKHKLLSRYRDDYESLKNCDVHDENANIEEVMPPMEERQNVVLSEQI